MLKTVTNLVSSSNSGCATPAGPPFIPENPDTSTMSKSSPTSTAIIWPSKYTPGTTDNYVSNEVIAKDISATQIWSLLVNPLLWPTYYANASQVTPPSQSSPSLKKGDKFSFSTFGFPPLGCVCEESITPDAKTNTPGRLAWSAGQDGDEDSRLDVYHAWIIEDLDGDRVRILTQESQIGKPARDLAGQKPNPMLNGHQEWLDGLVKTAREEKV